MTKYFHTVQLTPPLWCTVQSPQKTIPVQYYPAINPNMNRPYSTMTLTTDCSRSLKTSLAKWANTVLVWGKKLKSHMTLHPSHKPTFLKTLTIDSWKITAATRSTVFVYGNTCWSPSTCLIVFPSESTCSTKHKVTLSILSSDYKQPNDWGCVCLLLCYCTS